MDDVRIQLISFIKKYKEALELLLSAAEDIENLSYAVSELNCSESNGNEVGNE